ncbi:MAG: UDP-3-O-acyl-N-acetylglucosamine deacetylase, partial [Gammaproteobacteria bacterium]|nr:UDP-3-O-acyl-N-acetylglucosamine deacetylase [Gammaproteobacteria bacterium]
GNLCKLKPSSENRGIVIKRIDLPEQPEFDLNIENVLGILPGLQNDWLDLASYLPLLAVVRALDIDNLLIESNSRSFPDFGNKASALLFLVQSAGVKSQNALKKTIELHAPLMVSAETGGWVRLMPSEKVRMAIISSETNDKTQHIALKNMIVDFTAAYFTSELCHTRSNEAIEQEVKSIMAFENEQRLYGRLAQEKTQRAIFEAFSVLSLLPYTLNADYVTFNSSTENNLAMLKVVMEALLQKEGCAQVVSQKSLSLQPNVAAVS